MSLGDLAGLMLISMGVEVEEQARGGFSVKGVVRDLNQPWPSFFQTQDPRQNPLFKLKDASSFNRVELWDYKGRCQKKVGYSLD